MMYAVYRNWGDIGCSGRDLLFVTASKQVAEDGVALAELEQEAAFAILCPEHDPAKHDAYHEKVAEYREKVAAILTIDPEGCDRDVGYYFEEVAVR